MCFDRLIDLLIRSIQVATMDSNARALCESIRTNESRRL